MVETTTSLEVTNEVFHMFNAYLKKQKNYVTRSTMGLVNTLAHNAELNRNLQTTWKDLTTTPAAAQENIKPVVSLQRP